jgi:hypothetical protein
MKPKLILLSQQTLDNGVKIIILGDAATQGVAYAEATIIFPKERV